MCTVDVLDQLDVGVVVIGARNLIRVSVVISSHLDEEKIRRLVALHIEFLRLVAKELASAAPRIRCPMPVPGLLIIL